jgi:hypothetical protein
MTVIGYTNCGEPVRVRRMLDLPAGALLVANAIESADCARPINGATASLAKTQAEIASDSLVFRVEREGSVLDEIHVLLCAPSLYQEVSGLPAPDTTTASQGYGGWLLP